MDEQKDQNQPMDQQPMPNAPSPTPGPDAPPLPTDGNKEGAAPMGVEYASYTSRFAAVLIDGILFTIIFGPIYALAGEDNAMLVQNLYSLVFYAYSVYLLTNKGATIGKMAMHIKVQKLETGENPSYVDSFLREVIGKTLSLIFMLGYLWPLLDDKKQGWHDKLAKTIVVKAK